MKFISRIGISVIVNRHFRTFYNYGLYEWVGKRKVPASDIFTFIILPLILSLTLVFLDVQIVKNFSELIVTSLSIFVGLLFSLLTLVYDMAKKGKEKVKEKPDSHITKAAFILTKELFVNISYAIALSIICIVFIFIAEFRPRVFIEEIRTINHFSAVKAMYLFIINSIVVFLLLQFALTLLMILKRFFIIYNKEIENDDDQ